METTNKPLQKLNIFSIKGIQMRTFHLTWMAFFLCFFGWFGLAPLMTIIKTDLGLTKGQIGNIIIASVAATVIARIAVGKLCDTWGPRKTYTALLGICSIPVMTVGLVHSYEGFLLFRLAIGVIGASFVVTQYHTSVMFDRKIVGTANAVAGGWGNLGGGVTNMVMPLIFAGFIGAGYLPESAWRLAMVIPGVLLLIFAFVYYFFTKDTPAGNFDELPEYSENAPSKVKGTMAMAMKDPRTWALFLAYGACFGIEITFDNIAALYFFENFHASLAVAGILAGTFGFMNLFARALGGIVADKVGLKYGMLGKGRLLALLLALEGQHPDDCGHQHVVFCYVFENGQRGYLCHCSFCEPESHWFRERNCRRRRQCRGSTCRIFVQIQFNNLFPGICIHRGSDRLCRSHCSTGQL
jgi:NNP family nitrate/nitrite transporter-like MFS transporter